MKRAIESASAHVPTSTPPAHDVRTPAPYQRPHHSNQQLRDANGQFISMEQVLAAQREDAIWLARVRAGRIRAQTAKRDAFGQFAREDEAAALPNIREQTAPNIRETEDALEPPHIRAWRTILLMGRSL
jgi:hypothetical protein